MSAAFVQGGPGSLLIGNGAGAFSSETISRNWGIATTNGNLLVCLCVAETYNTGGSVSAPTMSPPTTTGITWVLAAQESNSGNNNRGWGTGISIAIYYAVNAPSASACSPTSVTVSGGATRLEAFIQLIEVSGCTGLDTTAVGTGGIGGIPSTANLSTSATDFIFGAAEDGDTLYWSAGTGYTFFTFGSQYNLSVSAGSIPFAFAGSFGADAPWACTAVAFTVGSPSLVSVINVSPNNGPIAGGTAVTITGTDFLSGATVEFGGNPATSVVVVSPTSITCVTPAGAAGSVTVSITDTDGTGSLANAYTYTDPILDVSPSSLSFGAVFGGSNPASQNVTVANGNGGTLSWSVSSDESWLTASPTSGINFDTVATSVDITGLAVGSYTGHLTFSASGAVGSPQIVTVTLTIASSGGGGGGSEYMFVYFPSGSEVDFTPVFSPVAKQPEYQWGLEAKRADSITVDGQKQSVCERIDQVTTVKFPSVAASDMAAWKAFELFALTGSTFFYRPNIGWPDDTGYLTCAMVSMDWTPKFKSFGIFSLDMKLRLVEEAFVGS